MRGSAESSLTSAELTKFNAIEPQRHRERREKEIPLNRQDAKNAKIIQRFWA
jgi:hypothetical protein